MVAVIHAGSNLRNILNYNEQKVKEGVAVCLAAGNYPKDVSDLSFRQKLNRLQSQAALNLRTKVNGVHISLNFDPSEKLSEDKLVAIGDSYLKKIGFASQPYLLYQHHDSGHPHIHIVTTNIQSDGKRIALHNLGKNQSEKARKEIEIDFKLLKAQGKGELRMQDIKLASFSKAQYGKTETKRAISNVLSLVLNNYKYTSLPELNAVLRQYNVLADRGTENSRVYQNKGLTFRILNEEGKKVGVPIKASDFYNKPTIKFLEKKFAANEMSRHPHKPRLKNAIDVAFLKQPTLSLSQLVRVLEKSGIHVSLRQNDNATIYGITYTDHITKCVFNGSSLGKRYSAAAIQERCREATPGLQKINLKPGIDQMRTQKESELKIIANTKANPTQADLGRALDVLMRSEQDSNYLPSYLKKKARRKRRRRISIHP